MDGFRIGCVAFLLCMFEGQSPHIPPPTGNYSYRRQNLAFQQKLEALS